MYDTYFLRILMREREQEILEELKRGGYHARIRRGGSGLSKKIARQLLSTFLRFKAIAGPRQSRQQVTDLRGRCESWKKEFS